MEPYSLFVVEWSSSKAVSEDSINAFIVHTQSSSEFTHSETELETSLFLYKKYTVNLF